MYVEDGGGGSLEVVTLRVLSGCPALLP
jgi:hypothetical protein